MKQLDPGSVDVVVTSPPYNLGISYNTYCDEKTDEEYLDWCEEWAAAIAAVLARDGSFFLVLGGGSENPFLPFSVAMRVGKFFQLQNTIHWIKAISIERENGITSYGHFKPINSQRFVNDCHEYVFHFTLGGKTKIDRLAVGVPYADKTNVQRWSHTNGRDQRCRGNTWFVPYKTIHQRATQRPHPATFPVELAVKCIRLHGKRNATVLDPFLGIGHAALAAKECSDLVERFIGFEIDEEYIKVAAELVDCSYCYARCALCSVRD
jgi:site-specific DNA-methyltransferase (adenine-specific)